MIHMQNHNLNALKHQLLHSFSMIQYRFVQISHLIYTHRHFEALILSLHLQLTVHPKAPFHLPDMYTEAVSPVQLYRNYYLLVRRNLILQYKQSFEQIHYYVLYLLLLMSQYRCLQFRHFLEYE